MKATLKFTLPEEAEDFRLANQGGRFNATLHDIIANIRNWRKHGHTFKTADEALDAVWDMLWQQCRDNEIDV